MKLDTKKFQHKLEEKRASLEESLQVRSRQALSTQPINPDRADLAQNYYFQDREYALVDRLEETLDQVKAALNRIETGDYGKCVRCGKDISNERLEALPHVELCINCQILEERQS